jgi:hypothetical protein
MNNIIVFEIGFDPMKDSFRLFLAQNYKLKASHLKTTDNQKENAQEGVTLSL